MNFGKSWIMDCGSSLRRKRTRTSIICDANLHSPPWNIPSKAHKIRTTWKRRWIFKRALGNRCLHDAGKTRPPRKAAAQAAAAAPCQYIRESPTTEKKIAFERTEFGRWSLDDRRGEDITRDSHLQVCLLRHHDRCHSEETRGMYQYWERRSGTKSQKLIEKTCEDWSHCLYRRSFESVKWAIFVQSEDPQADYSTKNDELRKDFLQEYNSSVPCIEHEIITLLQKLDWEQEKKSERSCTEDVHTGTERRQTFPLTWEVCNLFRQQCKRSRSSYRYKEIEEGKSSNSLAAWAKCKVLNFLLPNAATNFGRQSLSHHHVPVSTLEESVVKVVKENGEDNCSQDNSRLEKTRCNTPKNLRAQEFRRFKHASGTESNLQTWKLWPSSIRESQLAGRGVTRTSSTCKELKNSSMMLSRRRISLPKISSKRSTRNNFEMIFEKLNWPILILHNWKGSIQRHHRKLRDWEGRSLRDACLGKPRSFHSQWLMKSQLMGQVPARKVKKDMEWEFSKGSEPRRRIEVFFFFVKMVMEWWMLIFPTDFQGFAHM